MSAATASASASTIPATTTQLQAITGNVFVNDGLSVYSSHQNTVEDNTVNGKPLVYLEDVSDYKVEDAGQVILVNCTNITVENLDLSNTSGGIALWKTENSKISNNTVCNNNRGGISLSSSSNNTITGNNVSSNNNRGGICIDDSSNNNTITGNNVSSNNWSGISLSSSSNNTITGNNVSNNNWSGISLSSSSNNNTITGNNVSSNGVDIRLCYSSNNNTITGNNVSNNDWGSIHLHYSSNNKIYFNNFINNIDIGYSIYDSTTIWNSPLEITYTYDATTYKSYLGNYWDDYEGTDADGDGSGDTHYSIYSYPLMKPFENYILPRSALT
jgi:parallel beta-helix repeat protein